MTAKPLITGAALAIFVGAVFAQQAKPPAATPAATGVQPTAEHTGNPPAAQVAPVSSPEPATPTAAVPAQTPAQVEYRDGLLHVVSSGQPLNQVLHQIASLTGMSLQGTTNGDLLYGSYGPGAPAEVLTNILDGLRYNIVMSQAAGSAVPQQLVISQRNGEAIRVDAVGASHSGAESAQAPQPSAPGTRPPPYREAENSPPPPQAGEQEPAQPEETPEAEEPQPVPDPQPAPEKPPAVKTPEQFLQELKQIHDQRPPQ